MGAWMNSEAKFAAPVPANLNPPAQARRLEGQSPSDNLLDLDRWISAIRRRLPLIAAAILVALIGAVVLTMLQTPIYAARASIMIDTRESVVVNTPAVLQGLPQSSNDASTIDTQVELIRSRELVAAVVEQLNLDEDPEFNPLIREPSGVSGLIQEVRGLFGGSDPSETATAATGQMGQDIVIEIVRSNLSVQRNGLTYLLTISFRSQDPEKAAQIANAFADAYLDDQILAKVTASREANQWLNQRLAELKGQVEQAEAAVQQYKIQNGLMSASGTTLTEQEISQLNQQAAQARADLAEAQARLSTARAQLAAGSSGEDVGEALDSSVIQQLRAQRAAVSGRVADLQGRYGPRHPEMLKAQRELEDIDAQIGAEVRRIISNLEARAQVARQRLSSIQGSLGGAEGRLASSNRASVELQQLERNAEAVRVVYQSYLARYKETSTQQGLERADARIVARASTPLAPVSPNVAMNLLLGLLLGLSSAMALVVLLEMLDNGIATARDVETRLGVNYLAGVPLLDGRAGRNAARQIVDKPTSAFAEAFRQMTASLRYASAGAPARVVAVTSALPGEGKTTTSVCLARSLSLQGYRTILVECDLRRPAVSRVLGAEPKTGLVEVLSGETELKDALLWDDQTGAAFLPISSSTHSHKDTFGSDAMDEVIAKLSAEFEMIILDTAPALAVADTRIIARKADTVLFLVRWRKTSQKAVETALDMLADVGAHIAGVALTQVDLRAQSRSGYGDPGFYYKSYAKYYAN